MNYKTTSAQTGLAYPIISRKIIKLERSGTVSINKIGDILDEIVGIEPKRSYNFGALKGVLGRSSNDALLQKLMG